jgi:transposase-like protein
MAQRPEAAKQNRWLELIRRWQRSQFTVREFCQRHRVSEPSFYAWRRVLRERGLIQDSLAEPATSSAPAFVKLTLDAESAAASAVDLVLSDRRVLRVRRGFDVDLLLELARLLEAAAC